MTRFGYLVFLLVALIASVLVLPGNADAQDLSIRVNLEPARQMLSLACSGRTVDEAATRADPLLRTQLAHQSSFGAQFSIENYLAGLRSIVRCKVPSPDPFRMASLVNRREMMTRAIEFLSGREQEIGRFAGERIRPYVPVDFKFSGSVVPL